MLSRLWIAGLPVQGHPDFLQQDESGEAGSEGGMTFEDLDNCISNMLQADTSQVSSWPALLHPCEVFLLTFSTLHHNALSFSVAGPALKVPVLPSSQDCQARRVPARIRVAGPVRMAERARDSDHMVGPTSARLGRGFITLCV